jgi:hypothetical protein
LKDICVQKVKILQKNGGIFSPMKILPQYYGRKNTLGEILLYYDLLFSLTVYGGGSVMLLVKKRLEQHKPRHSEWNSEFTALL